MTEMKTQGRRRFLQDASALVGGAVAATMATDDAIAATRQARPSPSVARWVSSGRLEGGPWEYLRTATPDAEPFRLAGLRAVVSNTRLAEEARATFEGRVRLGLVGLHGLAARPDLKSLQVQVAYPAGSFLGLSYRHEPRLGEHAHVVSGPVRMTVPMRAGLPLQLVVTEQVVNQSGGQERRAALVALGGPAGEALETGIYVVALTAKEHAVGWTEPAWSRHGFHAVPWESRLEEGYLRRGLRLGRAAPVKGADFAYLVFSVERPGAA